MSTDVGGVKTQLTNTQADLQKTIADLKSTRGDLGVQSGLIATNGTGTRRAEAFGRAQLLRVQDSARPRRRRGSATSPCSLKKTDPKKNKYTIDVLADDKTTEKKDKSINEPVQFYTAKARQPYEIVVNQVQKDMIVGYLTTPKEQSAR